MDRKKVIKEFEHILNEARGDYQDFADVTVEFGDEILSMLKEKEHSGVWEWITEDKYRCSECKNVTYVDECMNEPQYLYCPYCGCKMTYKGIWGKRE